MKRIIRRILQFFAVFVFLLALSDEGSATGIEMIIIEERPLLKMSDRLEFIGTQIEGTLCGEYFVSVDVEGTDFVLYLFFTGKTEDSDGLQSGFLPVHKFRPVINEKRKVPAAVMIRWFTSVTAFVEMSPEEYEKSKCLGTRV